MSYNGPVKVMRLGSFEATSGMGYGQISVSLELEERKFDRGREVSTMDFPVNLVLQAGDGQAVRISVKSLDAFIGLLKGHAIEIRRLRGLVTKELEKLGLRAE